MSSRPRMLAHTNARIPGGGSEGAGRQSEPLLRQVRCARCGARLFDTRFDWRHCEVSVANVLIQCWRCRLLAGIRLAEVRDVI